MEMSRYFVLVRKSLPLRPHCYRGVAHVLFGHVPMIGIHLRVPDAKDGDGERGRTLPGVQDAVV